MAVVSREVLKKYLMTKLTYDGKMTVPMTTLKDAGNANFPEGKFETSETITRLVQPTDKMRVKEFMRDHYFTSAVVPAAIKLRETWPKYPFLSSERRFFASVGPHAKNGHFCGASPMHA